MDQKRFDIGQAITYGWEIFKENWVFLVVTMLVAGLASGIPNSPSAAFQDNFFIVQGILSLLSLAISAFVGIALIRIGLKYVSQEIPDYPDWYMGYEKFWNFLAGSILYGLIVLGGFILLIVPGVIWGIKYQFFGYLIIDRDMDPVEAIKQSGELTNGVKGDLFLFDLVLALMNLAGLVLCCFPVLITGSISLVAQAYVYRSLLATEPQAVQAPPAAPVA